MHGSGAEHSEALRRLHALMVRAAAHQLWRMRSALPDSSTGTVDVIVNEAADEAMTALLGKLDSFEGRSRFTTWAFKFAPSPTAGPRAHARGCRRPAQGHDALASCEECFERMDTYAEAAVADLGHVD